MSAVSREPDRASPAPPAASRREPSGSGSPPESIILGDRLCARCGFNLTGQPITREPRYDLLIARCPHCGQVAAMEEYPPRGQWTSRWAFLGAAAWLLFVVMLTLGGAGFIAGTTIGFTAEATDRYQAFVRQHARDWYMEHNPQATRWRVDDSTFPAFWAERGEQILASGAGRLSRAIERDELALLLIPGSAAFVLGLVWSVLLIQWPRRPLIFTAWILTMLVLLLVGGIWIWIKNIPMTSADQVVWVHVRMPVLACAYLAMGMLFIIGITWGRTIVRGLARALVPPGFRGALSVLWTAEGLPPPRPHRATLRRVAPKGPPP